MILAGDIGGTKAVLAVFEVAADGALTSVRETVYHCADYPSLEAVLDVFLPAAGAHGLSGACFGVAGPVVGGVVHTTNLPWTIDAASVSAKLGVPVALINDLQATALGTLVLPASAFAVLQTGVAAPPGATIAIIAPGTGLGESLLVSDGVHYRALPSEGGHADFAPGTDEQIELLRYLRGVHGPHVSYERVLSGAGLGDLYDFVRAASGVAEPAWLTAEFTGHDRNAQISRVALDGRDPVCVRALDLFVEILGAEAGNVALRGLAAGGVVIGGGIPPKILPALKKPGFLERLTGKGRFSVWARNLPVRVALEPRAALFGAAHHAASHKDARS